MSIENSDFKISNLWEQVLIEHGDDNAIHYNGKYYTYKELDEKSWYVANYINKHVSSNAVGINMDCSFDYVCAVLGVMKSGKCFVPLDIQWPDDRISYVQQNCSLDCIIESGECSSFGTVIIEHIFNSKEQNFTREWKNGRSAYILYSSGTTGRPKGIEIGTDSLVNLIKWFKSVFLGPDIENIIQLAKISFDVSVEEILGSLMSGKTLFIPDTSIKYHKAKLRRYIAEHNINLIEMVPATLKEFLDGDERIASLKTIICGADVLQEELKNSIIKIGYNLYNNYGPTETTVDAMYERCSLDEPVQLGQCITGCCYVIIDENGNEVQKYGIGEIWFSGINLAIGYLNDDEMNKSKFIDYAGKRFYRTGDLVKLDDSGRVVFYGRIDNQIKLRGQRIELEEIERIFSEEMEIKLCTAIYKKEEFERIVLFYEAAEAYEYKVMVNQLGKRLPAYMIPSSFYCLEKLPRTDNGKVDRTALLEYNLEQHAEYISQEYDQITQKIVEFMVEILGRGSEIIDLSSELGQLGFDSLSYVRLLVEIEEYWHIEMDDEMLILDNELSVLDVVNKIKKNMYGDQL